MGAIRRAAAAASALLLARAEFAAVELTQTGVDALRWLLWALAATALMALTLIAATTTIVLALWDRLGWVSLGLLTLAYAIVTGYLLVRLRRQLHARRPLLAQTLAELSRDRDALFAHDAAAPQAERQAKAQR
ncbi:MAG TPA: phage holin family protein [Burkholderiaceae bacterium]|nr:phage holin family protein [Burkholderiaceae bacterium]